MTTDDNEKEETFDALQNINYPLGAVMEDSNPRTRIFETLLTTRRALTFGEIVRRTGVSESEVEEALRTLRLVGAVSCPSHGLYRFRYGSPVGWRLHHLREVLHARLYPESWAAEEATFD